MKHFLFASAAVLVSLSLIAQAQPTTPAARLVLKYGDGKPDGKRSIAGTGQMIRFELPENSQKVRGLRLHCARYGQSQAPQEDVEVSIVSGDENDVVHTEFVPYAKFKRGDERWVTLEFKEPIEVPQAFWVVLDFNAEQTKGVYLSFDTSTAGKYSKTGLPGSESKNVNTNGDWMVQVLLKGGGSPTNP